MAWDGATSYVIGDLAIRGNALFSCIQAHTNHDPFTDCATVLSGTYWEFFSLRGAVENYVVTAETVTATSLTLATTPDQATVFCPGGVLLWMFAAQWKLTGSPLAASSAQTQVDGSATNAPAINAAANAEGSNSLLATGVFWGTMAGNGGTSTGLITTSPSTSADANVIAEPYPGVQGVANVPTSSCLHVTPGVHTVGVLYAAGNGTTTVNVRDRRLKVFGQ